MTKCCSNSTSGQAKKRPKRQLFLWTTSLVILASYMVGSFAPEVVAHITHLPTFTQTIVELMNKMWWGLLLGVFMVGVLGKVPREVIMGILGEGGTLSGILRATGAGLLLDVCSHGVLVVGMKLYERGASLGQVMSFLIASPWNSLSLTLILWALVGLKWTLTLVVLSMVIAVISGLLFDRLVERGILPGNPNQVYLPKDFKVGGAIRASWRNIEWSLVLPVALLWNGLKGSKMILKWIFFGVIMAALIRAFISPDQFETFFGPTIGGLGLTLLVATILEVCSEGSTPIAADLLSRAKAPGNAFAFLMTGVSTDYTEILSLKETTKSWKIALFLPLVTLPQIIVLAWLLNSY